MKSDLFLVNLLMAVAWGAITGSFGLPNLIFGFLLATMALFIIRNRVGFQRYMRRSLSVVILILAFLWELVLAATRVLLITLRPRMNLNPGIIAVPLTVTRDYEITLLANMITLTPGTLSMDISEDRKTLYVHCIDVPDPEETVREIKEGFERMIMEAFR
ncbi:Na+/H+ antiporter subunit E [Flexibacterium corallicola]|uniref:Na+/H+ antiporter subunit E n=1 Tax=Flexibacterium corallicola TaxID=3037259 RepID=UPI00286F68BC|nr:Na+/H+ antiporter subunit E [Pseudovibrio sp. M1P-2-3]